MPSSLSRSAGAGRCSYCLCSRSATFFASRFRLDVRPNELALERPYIQHHIEATRSAYALNQRVKETGLEAQPEIPIDYAKHKPLLDNVRLWDWRAFHDQFADTAIRPYVYIDSDVDRYTIDGQIRQVLISPRELDIRQLGDARNRWINPHFIYTHGYGIVMAESNRITGDGLPVLFIKDAPPEVTTKSLKFTKPEIYYGEVAHEPVFVDTANRNSTIPRAPKVFTHVTVAPGGFPISSPLLRMAAALEYSDLNIDLAEPAHLKHPHDDPSARFAATPEFGWLSHLGHRSVPCTHELRPLGLDRGRIHALRCASLFAGY